MFGVNRKDIKLSEGSKKIIDAILEEEGLELNDEIIVDSIMNKYGSIDANIAQQLKLLYDGSWSLRTIAVSIVGAFRDHPQPEIFNLVPLIKFLSKHLQGIPFMSEWDVERSGDYDPTRPGDFLDATYKLFGSYHREGEKIDYIHEETDLKKINNLPKGDNEESQVITDYSYYVAYAKGWFKEREEKIAKVILSKDLTPSEALNVLAKYWKFYVTPKVFKNMTDDIEYCIYCAEEFPDTPEARKEFRHAVQAIHQPKKK